MTPLVLGLAGLGFDRAKPKPFCLSFKRVTPWYIFGVVEKYLDEVDKAMAAWDEARLMTRPAVSGLADNIFRELIRC